MASECNRRRGVTPLPMTGKLRRGALMKKYHAQLRAAILSLSQSQGATGQSQSGTGTSTPAAPAPSGRGPLPPREVHIPVRTQDSRLLGVTVTLPCTGARVKQQLAALEGTEPELLRLVLDGAELTDDMPLPEPPEAYPRVAYPTVFLLLKARVAERDWQKPDCEGIRDYLDFSFKVPVPHFPTDGALLMQDDVPSLDLITHMVVRIRTIHQRRA
jgi:hypothetical protein